MKTRSLCLLISCLLVLLTVQPGCGDKPRPAQQNQPVELYDQARELARQGEFEKAEQILNDLVKNQPDSDQGKLAAEYLRFEYPSFKATRLVQLGRTDEAEAILKPLLEQNLSWQERTVVQGQLDAISMLRVAGQQEDRNQALFTCRELQTTLLFYYQDNDGSYPPRLSMTELPYDNQALTRGLTKIENYTSDGSSFSFDATGVTGLKIHVTDQTIEVIK